MRLSLLHRWIRGGPCDGASPIGGPGLARVAVVFSATFLIGFSPAAAASRSEDLARETQWLARALERTLRHNGTLPLARASYEKNPLGGGDILATQWMLADFLRLQRREYQEIMAAARRYLDQARGQGRMPVPTVLLGRMDAFGKNNGRFLSLSQPRSAPTPELERMHRNLAASLKQLSQRVYQIRGLLGGASAPVARTTPVVTMPSGLIPPKDPTDDEEDESDDES